MPSYKNTERNSWYCAFYYTDWQGKRKKKKKEGFKTKREAQDFERKFLEQFAGTPNIPFEVLVDNYLRDAKIRLKATSYRSKESLIRNRILPFFKGVPIDQIYTRLINEWKNQLLQRNLTPGYIRSLYRNLSAMFTYAVEYYNLPQNPCGRLGTLPQKKKNVNYWTLDEFRKFATTLHKPNHIMLFYLLFWTGMRIGEALALTWDDIDLSAKTINVNKTLTRISKEDILTTPKTASSNRLIFLPQFLSDMLQDYKHISAYTSDRLFPLTRDSVLEKLHNGADAVGIKRIRIHDLRHSHASLLINSGFSPIEVADRLGHASASITLNTYSHFYTHKRSKMAEKINKLS